MLDLDPIGKLQQGLTFIFLAVILTGLLVSTKRTGYFDFHTGTLNTQNWTLRALATLTFIQGP